MQIGIRGCSSFYKSLKKEKTQAGLVAWGKKDVNLFIDEMPTLYNITN
jgi:hypothetical protein